jgi:hypothetical protein
MNKIMTKLVNKKTTKVQRKKPSAARTSAAAKERRARQETVAQILDQLFGSLARCSPELWERRAYLILVGSVYEKLAGLEGTVSIKELTALARILTSSRPTRLGAVRDRDSDSASAGLSEPPKAQSLHDAIQGLYGGGASEAAGQAAPDPKERTATDKGADKAPRKEPR